MEGNVSLFYTRFWKIVTAKSIKIRIIYISTHKQTNCFMFWILFSYLRIFICYRNNRTKNITRYPPPPIEMSLILVISPQFFSFCNDSWLIVSFIHHSYRHFPTIFVIANQLLAWDRALLSSNPKTNSKACCGRLFFISPSFISLPLT